MPYGRLTVNSDKLPCLALHNQNCILDMIMRLYWRQKH